MKKIIGIVSLLVVGLLVSFNNSQTRVANIKLSPTVTPSVLKFYTPLPTTEVTISTTPTVYIPEPTNTPYPTEVYVPAAPPVVNTSDSGFTCNCAKTCPSMSCSEAYYQLNQCGCSARDGDDDGVPCEAQCR